MPYPSVKTISEAVTANNRNLQPHDVKARSKMIRAIMEGDPCVNGETRLERIDAILGTCGVEHIPHGHNSKSPAIHYCNTGDTYGITIVKINGNFRVGCWGDIVEMGNYD